MAKSPQKVITIEVVSNKPDKRQAAIKADDGNWYNIWKDFEGEGTQEYEQLLWGNHDEPFKKGDQAIISYKEGEYNGNPQYTIKSMFPVDGQNTSTSENSSNTEQNRASHSNSDRNFDKENVGKCQSLFLQAFIQSGHSFSEALLQVSQAKRLAEMVIYGKTKGETVAPDIQEIANEIQEEDINIDDIPF